MPTRRQKDVFLQSLAVPRAYHAPCERREIIVSTNNGLHLCVGGYTTCLGSFSPWAPQKKSKFRTLFFIDVVTTHNEPRSYVKHGLDSMCVFFTGIGCVWGGGGSKGCVEKRLVQFFTLAAQKLKFPKFMFLIL